LNNYENGVSLLQGPPGTGKTKTIMGLLSGFLALDSPAHTFLSPSLIKSDSTQIDTSKQAEQTTSAMTFSLGTTTSGSGNILCRTDSSGSAPRRTSIQTLKNASATSVRSRLEKKLDGKSSGLLSVSVEKSSKVRSSIDRAITAASKKYCHILLCAPSNGAVDELVLRIVSDGLLDVRGNKTNVSGPTIHSTETIEVGYSIVRLGNSLEDAPDLVKSVCLPQILKREMEAHPKSLQLRTLMENQEKIRNSIREAHNKIDTTSKEKKKKTELPRLHASLTEVSGRIRRLRNEVNGLETQLTLTILSKARIIAGTLNKCGSGILSGLSRGFDALIVDEAAQAVELSTLVAIRERVARVVLVGDPQQLPATVKSVAAAKARYDRSLFERIAANGVAPSMLCVQYRMHPFLRDFPSKQFYGGLLKDGGNVVDRQETLDLYTQVLYQPFMVFDVNGTQEEENHGSKYNPKEANFCMDLCQAISQFLSTKTNPNKRPWTIGFISPYKEQVRVLRRKIIQLESNQNISLEVNTVDGFQGREKDVIIFSSVRASKHGGIGFLKDIRRLNVALTRARLCLFLVGNVSTLQRDGTWNALIKSAEERKLLIHTRGRLFDQVANQIEADRPELKEHFAQMHQKTKKKNISKSTSTSASSSVTVSPISIPSCTPRPSKNMKNFSKEKEVKPERIPHHDVQQSRKRPHDNNDDDLGEKSQKKQHQSTASTTTKQAHKQTKRPTSASSSSGGVLSSILGTASSLARSTSRVIDMKKNRY
jgi:senataxin